MLHLQCEVGFLDEASSHEVLRSLEQSGALRVLSLTRGMQVRRGTMSDNMGFRVLGFLNLHGCGHVCGGLSSIHVNVADATRPIL